MPVNAQQIRELMGLGIDGETLVKVVAIFDVADLTKKQRAAENAKRYRERKASRSSSASYDGVVAPNDGNDDKKKTAVKSAACECGADDAASHDANDALLLTSLSSTGSKEDTTEKEGKKEKKVSTRRKSSVTLRDDWRPSDSHFAAAAVMNIPAAKVLIKADDMRIWAKANDARKADWDATFHGFLRRDADKLSVGPPASPQLDLLHGAKLPTGVYVKADTPEWNAWCGYLRQQGKNTPPRDKSGGWRFDTLWPPTAEPAREVNHGHR